VVKAKLGKRIAALRKAKGWTQEQFAEKIGYSVEFLSLVERGINAPSVEGCERIAKALGIRLASLFDF
jgi:transcriptional regulator with XRE-family HTH domain